MIITVCLHFLLLWDCRVQNFFGSRVALNIGLNKSHMLSSLMNRLNKPSLLLSTVDATYFQRLPFFGLHVFEEEIRLDCHCTNNPIIPFMASQMKNGKNSYQLVEILHISLSILYQFVSNT